MEIISLSQIRRFFKPRLPKKPYSFRFNYFHILTDPINKTVKKEIILLENNQIFYSETLESINGKGKDKELILLKKKKKSAEISSDFNSFYLFLREIRFDTIGSASTHVSIYPGSPTITTTMELEICKKQNTEPEFFHVHTDSELALEGKNEEKFIRISAYIEKLKKKYFEE